MSEREEKFEKMLQAIRQKCHWHLATLAAGDLEKLNLAQWADSVTMKPKAE